MPWFDAITGALGEQNPYDAVADWSNATQKRNRAAVGLDANGNPLPQQTDANGNPVPPDPNNPQNNGVSAATGQALAAGQMQPNQQPQATKTDPSLGALLMNMTQYQQREQGFNQAMGAGFAAFSQPRDREWVSKIFNVNEPDPMKIGQQEQDLASQQQGQDRMNSLGALISGPQGKAIADSLNISQADLIARYRADPQGVGTMIQNYRQPTDQMKNLEQINTYNNVAPQISSMGGNAKDLASLRTQILAGVGGPEAAKMIADQITYRQTHNGQDPPWHDNIQAYNQSVADKATLSKNIDDAGKDLAGNVNTAETLRDKVAQLANNNGLARVLAMPQGSLTKQAFQDALDDQTPDWRSHIRDAGLINDPELMKALAEVREVNGQEYKGAIDTLLGHGLRPSQTEVSAVRAGFGQTNRITSFGSIKDYTNQAINPMLTRLDEAEATGYGAANAFNSMPARLRPFVHPIYLPGGKQNEEGSGSEGWAGNVHKQLSPEDAAALKQKMIDEPLNAETYRDQMRRKGYDVPALGPQ